MDLNKLLKQAQSMQSGMQAAQEKLAETLVEATGASDKIKVTATAAGDLRALSIDPSLLDPNDAEFLAEIILATAQKAIENGRALAAEEMKKHTGGLGIPGL